VDIAGIVVLTVKAGRATNAKILAQPVLFVNWGSNSRASSDEQDALLVS